MCSDRLKGEGRGGFKHLEITACHLICQVTLPVIANHFSGCNDSGK